MDANPIKLPWNFLPQGEVESLEQNAYRWNGKIFFGLFNQFSPKWHSPPVVLP